jgi:hypothetical protein
MEDSSKLKKSFIAYSILSIGLGMSLSATLLSLVLPVIFIVSNVEIPTFFDLAVRLNPAAGTGILANGDYFVSGISGNLTIINPTTLVSIISGSIPIIIFGSVSYGIFLFRKVIKNVHEGNHFLKENVKYIRIIALLVIIVPHVQVLLKNLIIDSLPKNLVLNGFELGKVLVGPVNIFSFSIVPDYILLGLLLLIFADVFKVGNRLKEDNDLTV